MPRKTTSRKAPATPPPSFPTRAGKLRLELLPSPAPRFGAFTSITSAGTTTSDELPPLTEWRFIEERWKRVSGGGGEDWRIFLDKVRRLPRGTLFRHNLAGDLPGAGYSIDATLFVGLLTAASDLRGFTFTRKPVLVPAEKIGERRPGLPAVGEVAHDEWKAREGNREPIRLSNQDSFFTTNLVARSLDEADRLAELAIGPVVVILGKEAMPKETPGGRVLLTCPAELGEGSCAACGLCTLRGREEVVTFRSREVPARTAKMKQLTFGGDS